MSQSGGEKEGGYQIPKRVFEKWQNFSDKPIRATDPNFVKNSEFFDFAEPDSAEYSTFLTVNYCRKFEI